MEDTNNKDKSVFYISLIVVACLIAWGVMGAGSFKAAGDAAFGYLTTSWGWFYVICMFAFVVFSVWVCCGKYGNIVLGKDGEKPAYSTLAWFAMLFSAGKGIGLLFYGVAEPLSHFVHPIGVEPGSPEAMAFAMRKSFLHWGLQPWAGYCVMALGLAYIQFRKDKPGLISSVLIPLIGEKRAQGPIGKFVDIMAIFATVAGVATSFGLGTFQINSGLNQVFGVPFNSTTQIIIVVGITAILLVSITAGLEKGMKRISSINLTLSVAIMAFMFIVAPKLPIMNGFIEGIGNYFSHYIKDSLSTGAFSGPEEAKWYAGWTIFYWSWWIAWAPFVGTFIARISRGRTIRQFVVGVLVAPTLAGACWFTIFGMSSMGLGLDVAQEAVSLDVSRSIYVVLGHFPLSTIMSVMVVVLLITFFLSSADSATFVLGMFSSNGNLNPKTSRKVMWALIQAGLALSLMVSGEKPEDGLNMLKTASICVAFPFAFILVMSMVSLVKGLRSEVNIKQKNSDCTEKEAISEQAIASKSE